jgi:5'-methylthioadenosine phosphorylase
MREIPVLGVIGGSGLYNFPQLRDTKLIEVETPFGKPSAPLAKGFINDKPVVFLARHGKGHHISPSEVNYRANIFALKQLGVTKVISISACGSLREDFSPGHIVIPDQVFDFSHKRERSFFGEGMVAHVSVADPFCPTLSDLLFQSVQNLGGIVHKGGTYITIEGPRFSTKAESNTYRVLGMSIIGMTAAPEVFLAKEAELCYATMAHVTDYDVWHESEEPVSVEMVIETLHKNTALAQNTIVSLVDLLAQQEECNCSTTLKNAIITDHTAIPEATRNKLSLFIDKYLD